MIKVYFSSVMIVGLMVGSLGAVAYQLGKFNAEVTRTMVASIARNEMVARTNVVYPFPVKKLKKRRMMIAEK